MIVYFVRHGIAEEADAWHASDAERPLTDKGRRKMAAIGKRLAQLEVELAVMLSSPLTRAWQTAEIVAEAVRPRAQLRDDERLAGVFDFHALTAILGEHAKADSVMLVGHEPNMSAVIGHAIGEGSVEMKKGAVACVEFADRTSSRGRLLWLVPPKILTG